MELDSSDGNETLVEKRARWETFSFTVCRNGVVNVRNESYGDDGKKHAYSVQLADGSPAKCSCPYFSRRNEACKHMAAVRNAPLVRSYAAALGEVAR